MNLYLISQTINDDYDSFDSAVVAAESEDKARLIHPAGDLEWDGVTDKWDAWCAAADVSVEFLGETHKDKGVICASYNAS